MRNDTRFNLALANGYVGAAGGLGRVAGRMTAAQIADAEARAETWQPN